MDIVSGILLENYGIDLSKIDPNLSDKDIKILAANQFVNQWIIRPENRAYLKRKKDMYSHDKGWSLNKNMKNEYDIPYEAWAILPDDIKFSQKELQVWVKKYHPYLMFSAL